MAGEQERPARYRAFISYSHADNKVARWLHRALETYRVPKSLVGMKGENGIVPRRIAPVFRDEDELAGAAELGPKLQSALTDSAALIVICSPASARSIWVGREIRFFKTVNPDRPVLALIAEGVPGSGAECFPTALSERPSADGTLVHDPSIEPLAPDLQKQEKQIVRLKLIAALLGVPYADLYRRDLRRARRRAAAFGTAGFLIMLALAVLAGLAFSYARLAVKQRNLAREAQAVAERNADLAERRAWLAQVAAEEVRRRTDCGPPDAAQAIP